MRLCLIAGLIGTTIFGAFAPTVQANSYETFTSFGVSKLDTATYDSTSWNVDSTYYFDKKKSLGPLNEFAFINSTNYLAGGYSKFEDSNSLSIRGEIFKGDWSFAAGVDSSTSDYFDSDSKKASVGYFIMPNLLVDVTHFRLTSETNGTIVSPKIEYKSTTISAKYVYSLQGSDYVGVSGGYTNNNKVVYTSVKYFRALQNDRYLSLGAGVSDGEDMSSTVSVSGQYYFNNMTSIGGSVSKQGDYDGTSVEFNHFFNDNWSVSMSWSDAQYETDSMGNTIGSYDVMAVNVGAQF